MPLGGGYGGVGPKNMEQLFALLQQMKTSKLAQKVSDTQLSETAKAQSNYDVLRNQWQQRVNSELQMAPLLSQYNTFMGLPASNRFLTSTGQWAVGTPKSNDARFMTPQEIAWHTRTQAAPVVTPAGPAPSFNFSLEGLQIPGQDMLQKIARSKAIQEQLSRVGR